MSKKNKYIVYYAPEDFDNIPNKHDFTMIVEIEDILEKEIFEKEDSIYRNVYDALLAGYTQEEIAEKLDISKYKVNRIIKKFREVLKEFYGEYFRGGKK